MAASFSFSRLGKLITKQFFENSRLYLFSTLAVFGLLALVFAFWVAAAGRQYREEETYIIFIFGLFITGCGFASMSFNMLGNKDKGIYWLGVPATHFEKLVCTIFFTSFAFTLVYCICFYVVKLAAVAFLKEYITENPGLTYVEMTDFEHGFGAALKYFVYAYFAVQAFYLLGSVYFRRYSLVVSTVVGAVVIFAFVYYMSKLQDAFFGGNLSWDLLSVRKFDGGIRNDYTLYAIPSMIADVLKYVFQFAWAPIFWLMTWYRLKEKQL